MLIIFQNSADEKKRQERRERLAFLASLNRMKCDACPIWGADLIDAVSGMTSKICSRSEESDEPSAERQWSRMGQSYVDCFHAVEPMEGRRNFETLWKETNTLRQLVHTPDQYLDELQDIIQR